jgi:hypothetical protein
MDKKMKTTYYFYVNFPRFKEKKILIHRNTCSNCKNGTGLRGRGSNEKGFWAGPFNKYIHAHEALTKLVSKFQNPPECGDCDCI